MLEEASRAIAQKSEKVTLIARSPEKLANDINARSISMDWNDAASVQKALQILREEDSIDCLVTWIHDKGLPCLPDFEKLLTDGARSIRVHGSAAGDPADGIKTDPPAPAHISRQNVVLGWMNEHGTKRWLTNHEISGGVIYAFNHPEKPAFVVGQLTR